VRGDHDGQVSGGPGPDDEHLHASPWRSRLVLHAPTRGLIGYQSELLSDTRGSGIMNRLFHEYVPHKGPIPVRHTGVLIANGDGEAVAYAMWNLEDRGPMFIDPGVKVYRGMIVGEHTRGNDLEVNVMKGKQLTNIRSAGKDDAVKLTPPVRMSLERALSYITDSELVEVTPENIRLRKILLEPHDRKRAERTAEDARGGGAATNAAATGEACRRAGGTAAARLRPSPRPSPNLAECLPSFWNRKRLNSRPSRRWSRRSMKRRSPASLKWPQSPSIPAP
jgi:hypothetical protein